MFYKIWLISEFTIYRQLCQITELSNLKPIFNDQRNVTRLGLPGREVNDRFGTTGPN